MTLQASGELHLIVLWENARAMQDKIIAEVRSHVEIVGMHDITWEQEAFSCNLSRFYGTKLPANSGKEKDCGNGAFLLLTVWDAKPDYALMETSRGTELVNTTLFALKNRTREWVGGGSRIHTTNSVAETEHDLALLLGINMTDYLAQERMNEIQHHQQNLAGDAGWKTLAEFFYILNACIPYVVLRNFEHLPGAFYQDAHGDIDLLVSDVEQTILCANARRVCEEPTRVHCAVMIDGKEALFDFRYVGDDYYCEAWQRNLLARREMHERGFYTPSPEDYFYTLTYHALYHKRTIAADYFPKLQQAHHRLFGRGNGAITGFDDYYPLLEHFMQQHGYSAPRPVDSSVFYDTRYQVPYAAYDALAALKIMEVTPFLCHQWKNVSGFIYFSGRTQHGERLFIKYGGLDMSVQREYEVLNILHAAAPDIFPQPYYYRCLGEVKLLAIAMVAGHTLDALDVSAWSHERKAKLFSGMERILQVLHQHHLLHRDIRPANIVVADDGTPVLLDLQFTVDMARKRFREYKSVRCKPGLIKGLGEDYAKGRYIWDDAYSMLTTALHILPDVATAFPDFYHNVSAMIGKKELFYINNNPVVVLMIRLNNALLQMEFYIKMHLYRALHAWKPREKYRQRIEKHRRRLRTKHRCRQ